MRSVSVLADVGPVVLEAGEGRYLGVLGDLYCFKVSGEATDGAYAIMEVTVFPQNGPPPHIHHREQESFYVLDGEFSLLCGDRSITATTGMFVNVPPGTLHTFKNLGPGPGRLLVIVSPAGLEKLLEQIGQPVQDPFSEPPVDPAAVRKLMELAPKYGLEIRAEAWEGPGGEELGGENA